MKEIARKIFGAPETGALASKFAKARMEAVYNRILEHPVLKNIQLMEPWQQFGLESFLHAASLYLAKLVNAEHALGSFASELTGDISSEIMSRARGVREIMGRRSPTPSEVPLHTALNLMSDRQLALVLQLALLAGDDEGKRMLFQKLSGLNEQQLETFAKLPIEQQKLVLQTFLPNERYRRTRAVLDAVGQWTMREAAAARTGIEEFSGTVKRHAEELTDYAHKRRRSRRERKERRRRW